MTPKNLTEAPPALQLLVRLLASQDAIHTPPRQPDEAQWAHRWVAYWSYQRGKGMPYHPPSANNAQAKENQRGLTQIVSAGLVRRFRTRASKTLHVALTEHGDQVGRALCGLPGMEHAVEMAQLLYARRDHPLSESEYGKGSDFDPRRPWIAEIAFLDEILPGVPIDDWPDIPKKDWPGAILWVSDRFRCAIVRGWIEYNSDSHRRVWYRLTEPGVRVATGEVPRVSAALPEPLSDGLEQYDRLVDDALGSLQAQTERLAEMGRCPLRCSILTKGATPAFLADNT